MRTSQSTRAGSVCERPAMEALEGRALLSVAALDPTFGDGGAAVLRVEGIEKGHMDQAWSVAEQADGKIVVLATAGKQRHFVVARYNPDGTIDSSFGDQGVVKLLHPAGKDGFAASIAVQPDGKVLVAGEVRGTRTLSSPENAFNDGHIYRLNADGSLDTSFGAGGRATVVFGKYHTYIAEVAVLPNGKILAGGRGATPGSNGDDYYVARLNADGSADSSYGRNGIASADTGTYDMTSDMEVQPDGKVLLTGWRDDASTSDRVFAAVRFDAKGKLDSGFDKDGIVLTAFDRLAASTHVKFTPDGKILVAGEVYQLKGGHSITNIGLVRYNDDGSLDKSFGEAGKVLAPVKGGGLIEVVVEADGDILAGTSSGGPDGVTSAVVKFNGDGALDATFGDGGRSVIDTGSTNVRFGRDMMAGADGKLLFAGLELIGNGHDSTLHPAVVRVDPNADAPPAEKKAEKKAQKKRKKIGAREDDDGKKAAKKRAKKTVKVRLGAGALVVLYRRGALIIRGETP